LLAAHLYSVDCEFRADPFTHSAVDTCGFFALLHLWVVVSLAVEGLGNLQYLFWTIFPAVGALLASFGDYEYLT